MVKQDVQCRWCHHLKSEHKGSRVFGNGSKCTVRYCSCVFFAKSEEEK